MMRAKARPPAPAARPPARMPSVLVMAHAHPRLSHGGGEISAYAMFAGLRARGGAAWFLGCGGPRGEGRLGAALSQPYGPREYLYAPAAPFDYFKFANRDPNFPPALAALVAELRPDIVHAHHYLRFGVEAFGIIKRASPATRIVLSLHEYLGICNNHGQMVKTGGHRLCARSGPAECAGCFPAHSPADFFLRRRYIQAHLADIDLFLAPSAFLAARYAAWGLPEDRIVVLENMPPAAPADDAGSGAAPFPAIAGGRPVRFGFFGQLSPLKGIDVLIEAARLLQAGGARASVEIHGDASNQPAEFQEAVRVALAGAGPAVTYHGPYENAQVRTLMRQVDAVVVPSVWWENSPVVIQEAFAAGRPVICSDIGGMAEKVRPGIDGLHFETGRPESLAAMLAALAARPETLGELAATLGRPPGPDAMLDAHLAAYAVAAGRHGGPGAVPLLAGSAG